MSRALGLGLLLALATGCGERTLPLDDDDPPGPQQPTDPPPGQPTTVRIAPSSLEMVPGAQQLMSATPVNGQGIPIAATCAWTTSDAAVAAISSAGALSAVAPGSAVVSATCGGVSGTASVTVVAGALGSHVIAFVSTAKGVSRWYRMDGSGAAATLIRATGAAEGGPVLSPDGQRIAFVSRGRTSGDGIFVMRTDGSEAIQLTRTAPGSSSAAIGWSSDGTRVFYLTSALDAEWIHTADLSAVNAGGGTATHLVTIPHSWGHTLSPDGSMIAFISDTELRAMRTDGTEERTLATAGPEIPFPIEPAWSPDGQWIAFSSDGCDMGNLSNLYLVRADGSDLTMLARFDPGALDGRSWACVGAPNWSPDGTGLVVSTHDPAGGPPAGFNTVSLVNVPGGASEPWFRTRFWVPQSAWSKDGTALAILQYTGEDDPATSLYLSSPAGAQPVLLTGNVSGMVFLQ